MKIIIPMLFFFSILYKIGFFILVILEIYYVFNWLGIIAGILSIPFSFLTIFIVPIAALINDNNPTYLLISLFYLFSFITSKKS